MITKNQTKEPTEQTSEGDNDLQDLFLDELKDMLHAEQQITKALPKMIKAAKDEDLRTALEEHLEETNGQITRLEKVFASLHEEVATKPCKGMKGILEEGDEMVKETKETNALDAAVVAAGQKVEHYEIASYGTLIAWAQQLGHEEAGQLLQESLDEEEAADGKLTEIGLSIANPQAE